MRYPPALTFTPRASWVYRSTAVAIAIVLIATCAYLMPASSHDSLKFGIFFGLAAAASLWMLRDAYKRPRGSLHYAQGQWQWRHESREIAGTLRLHIDLQRYMLVSFRAHSAPSKFFQTTTQWFHLEARHIDHAALPAHAGAWAALRRAVYSPMEPADETLAA